MSGRWGLSGGHAPIDIYADDRPELEEPSILRLPVALFGFTHAIVDV